MNLEMFLLKHSIVKIGMPISGEIAFAETIVDSPNDLISVLDDHYYISQILWWDRVLISTGSKIGYGGPRDPRDPDNYFFAETDIYREFSPDTMPHEYVDYINSVRREYRQYDLYPAFDISVKLQ